LNAQDFIQKINSEAEFPVQVYAHYWGKFNLVENYTQSDQTIFAEVASTAFHRFLSFKGDKVYILTEEAAPLLLTHGIASLFKSSKIVGGKLVYDARLSYHNIFSPQQMYVSDFRDPEDFEEVDAYVDLIKGIDAHFGNIFGIKNIVSEESGQIKKLGLELSEQKWDIKLERELFDLDLLHSLNQLLIESGKGEESLHLSINPEMYMVILKLDNERLGEIRNMGLIV